MTDSLAVEWVDWIDYEDRPEDGPYAQAHHDSLLAAFRADQVKTCGEHHQNGKAGMPRFSDGAIGRFSMRAWGSMMAKAWLDPSERTDLDYMLFYMCWGDDNDCDGCRSKDRADYAALEDDDG